MTDDDHLLARGSRAVLLAPDGAGVARPMPAMAWWDGAGMWLAPAERLPAGRDLPVMLLVPPAEGEGAGVLAGGVLRSHRVRDPLRLFLHAAPVSGALAALAVRGGPSVARRAELGRVMIDEARVVEPSPPDGALAPALPAAVPADVRRALAGMRDVALLTAGTGGVEAEPASWSGGLVITGAPAPSDRVAVVLDSGGAVGTSAGLLLEGAIGADGRLRPERAVWWRAAGPVEEAPVSGSAPTFTLPD